MKVYICRGRCAIAGILIGALVGSINFALADFEASVRNGHIFIEGSGGIELYKRSLMMQRLRGMLFASGVDKFGDQLIGVAVLLACNKKDRADAMAPSTAEKLKFLKQETKRLGSRFEEIGHLMRSLTDEETTNLLLSVDEDLSWYRFGYRHAILKLKDQVPELCDVAVKSLDKSLDKQ